MKRKILASICLSCSMLLTAAEPPITKGFDLMGIGFHGNCETLNTEQAEMFDRIIKQWIYGLHTGLSIGKAYNAAVPHLRTTDVDIILMETKTWCLMNPNKKLGEAVLSRLVYPKL